ncbi:mitochondrial AAA ATPase [Pyrenophora seminiperda CCB06]|uniref:Mitochondrial AAA ATPase n=1 Tax=Pyrenophora seminiperda CCB06 TaxID=1302712 RepID=A0A3M7MIM7_9PLEO|nr:mitochondrial AAA ATPase [Pyrenophora seminiperda CCB06]
MALPPSPILGVPSTSGSRLVRGRRYPWTPRLRTLHTTRPLAQASNPPPAPNSTPADQDGANKTDRDKAAATDEPADGTVALDDAEVLAQKLQRSRETSRRYSAALRRQQRGKKANGLSPVHLPDWFLKKRVLRRQDVSGDSHHAKSPTLLSVVVTHAESGEQAVCTVPAGFDPDTTHILSRLVRGLWSWRLDDNEKHKVEQYLEGKSGLQNEKATPKPCPPDNEPVASADGGHKHDALAESLATWTRFEETLRKRDAAKISKESTSGRISPLVTAEIRATMAASLASLQPALGNSFPATKTNLILHSPTTEHEAWIDACVKSSAFELGSDVIVLEAQDLAQLAGDYLGEGAESSPRSIRSLGYETHRLDFKGYKEDAEDTATEDETDWSQPPSVDQSGPNPVLPFITLTSVYQLAAQYRKGAQIVPANQYGASTGAANDDSGRTPSQGELQLEDIKLATFLEALIDSNDIKQSRGIIGNDISHPRNPPDRQPKSSKGPGFFDYSLAQGGAHLELNSTLPATARPKIDLVINIGSSSADIQIPTKSRVIYVKDFKEMNATYHGGRIIQKLEELVRKRRVAGESIMIVGSTCSRELTPELTTSGVCGLQSENETGVFRCIVIAADSSNSTALKGSVLSLVHATRPADPLPEEKNKFRRINLIHIQDMLRALDPCAAASISDMDLSPARFHQWAPIFSDSAFKRVLTYDEVHRVALTALGLLITSPKSNSDASKKAPAQLSWAHVALAMGLLRASDATKFAYFNMVATMPKQSKNMFYVPEGKTEADLAKKRMEEKARQHQQNMQRMAAAATKWEKRLLPGIVDPDQIKTTFDQVHVPIETVDSIRTITSLSLLRPEAFSYGILATEKISGALLYGPPGTGKTLLAKAVAKESGSTVLEVSGTQIMDKYVGEGEKNVSAIFSLARKLSPCIVFLDEADAVFASRDAMQERTSHRNILNQFLKEWDGLNDLSVFVMVATNRPFDLDDAVIRRLPRRLLVDLPTQADRKEILRIHLKGEQLDGSVDLDDIAKRTPFYSGSDLKNISVSAALACVKEENEQVVKAATEIVAGNDVMAATFEPTTSSPESTTVEQPPQPKAALHLIPGQSYNFPEKRVLHARHFDKALQEISASISENMSSLNAIKKFDEQYGDHKGNKRRKDFGFGVMGERNENAARVASLPPSAYPPMSNH